MTSNDLLATLSNTGIAKQLGLPTVPALRRHRPGGSLLAGPVLVASAGDGRFAEPVAAFVREDGQQVITEAGEEKLHGVVVDLTGARTLADLAAAQQILTPTVKRVGPSGRVLLIGAEPAEAPGAEAAAVAQALDGLVRSIGKELRFGATANLLVVAAGAPPARSFSPFSASSAPQRR